MRGNRRKAREDALQILYQLDLNPELTVDAAIARFQSCFSQEAGVLDPFTLLLVMGVRSNLETLDTLIKSTSEHWRSERMAAVDRNLLRLGVYELQFCQDIPATVSINEMIELAKQFGSENSPAFINGILDKIKGTLSVPGKAS